MKLNEPKVVTWIISVILGILAVIFLLVPSLNAYAIWAALAGLLLLILANVLKGL